MINALRTLLLNRSGADRPGYDYPGEEYVPASYMARVLPPALRNIHQLTFGVNPDRAMLNYRLRELLAILHSSPMVEAVLDLDTRVTYLPFSSDLFDRRVAGPVVQPLGGTTAVLYPLVSQGVSDQLYYSWKIIIVNGTDVSISVLSNPSAIPPPVTLTYTSSGGISSVVALPGSPHSVRFQPTVGAEWILTFLQVPTLSLADVYENAKQGWSQTYNVDLFGSEHVEPYLSFQNLWEMATSPSWQLCGLVLALGYRINELV